MGGLMGQLNLARLLPGFLTLQGGNMLRQTLSSLYTVHDKSVPSPFG